VTADAIKVKTGSRPGRLRRLVTLPKRHKQFSLFVLIVAAAALAAYLMIISRKEPEHIERQTPAPLVEVVRLNAREIPMIIRGYGTVSPKVEVEIAPQVAGNIVWLNSRFTAGGFIRANEPIIKIDPRDYELGVQQAEALVAEAAVSVDTEQAEAEVAKQEWRQLNPDTKPSSPLVLRQPQIRRAQAQLESAEARLKTARLNLDRTILSMPLDIRIVSKQVDLGQFVAAGRTVSSAYGIDVVQIEVPLEDKALAWFDVPQQPAAANGDPSVGGSAVAAVVADFAGARHTWTGYVKRTVGEVDRKSRLVSVVVEVRHPFEADDSQPPLVPGMFVEVLIEGRTLKNAFAVPRYALHEENTLWLIVDGKLRIRPVDIVRADKDFAYVLKGLDNGVKLVVSSLDVATDGMSVRYQPAAAAEQTKFSESAPAPDVRGADE